jgi:hypothetical protein
MKTTIWDVLGAGGADRPAVGRRAAPGLTYGALRDLAQETVAALNASGIGRGRSSRHRAPQRPGDGHRLRERRLRATAAPLNPAYRAEEFEFLPLDLKPRPWS